MRRTLLVCIGALLAVHVAGREHPRGADHNVDPRGDAHFLDGGSLPPWPEFGPPGSLSGGQESRSESSRVAKTDAEDDPSDPLSTGLPVYDLRKTDSGLVISTPAGNASVSVVPLQTCQALGGRLAMLHEILVMTHHDALGSVLPSEGALVRGADSLCLPLRFVDETSACHHPAGEPASHAASTENASGEPDDYASVADAYDYQDVSYYVQGLPDGALGASVSAASEVMGQASSLYGGSRLLFDATQRFCGDPDEYVVCLEEGFEDRMDGFGGHSAGDTPYGDFVQLMKDTVSPCNGSTVAVKGNVDFADYPSVTISSSVTFTGLDDNGVSFCWPDQCSLTSTLPRLASLFTAKFSEDPGQKQADRVCWSDQPVVVEFVGLHITTSNVAGVLWPNSGGVLNVLPDFRKAKVVFRNCTLMGNAAARGGVAASFHALDVSVIGGQVSGNSADMGGGFYSDRELSLSVSEGAVIDNQRARVSGAVAYSDGALTLTTSDADIGFNRARFGGVAFTYEDCNITAFDGSYFHHNVANSLGGVAVSEFGLLSLRVVSNTARFERNAATSGGILWAYRDVAIEATGSPFVDNIAVDNGCVAYTSNGGLIFTGSSLHWEGDPCHSSPLVGDMRTPIVAAEPMCHQILLIDAFVNTTIPIFDIRGSSWTVVHATHVRKRLLHSDGKNRCYVFCGDRDEKGMAREDNLMCSNTETLCQHYDTVALQVKPWTTTRTLYGDSSPSGANDKMIIPLPSPEATASQCDLAPLPLEYKGALACPSEFSFFMCLKSAKGPRLPKWVYTVIGISIFLVAFLCSVILFGGAMYVRQSAEMRRITYDLLCRAIPEAVVRILRTGRMVRYSQPSAVPVFGDIVGYTQWSENKEPERVVGILDDIFGRFDAACTRLGLVYIKTVGDCFFAAAGAIERAEPHINLMRATVFAWECIKELEQYKREVLDGMDDEANSTLSMRFGLCEGPVVAGVIGKRSLQFDLYGQTVNMASRMESLSEPNRLRLLWKDACVLDTSFPQTFTFTERSFIEVKGKGLVESCLLIGVNMDSMTLREALPVLPPRSRAAVSGNADRNSHQTIDRTASDGRARFGVTGSLMNLIGRMCQQKPARVRDGRRRPYRVVERHDAQYVALTSLYNDDSESDSLPPAQLTEGLLSVGNTDGLGDDLELSVFDED